MNRYISYDLYKCQTNELLNKKQSVVNLVAKYALLILFLPVTLVLLAFSYKEKITHWLHGTSSNTERFRLNDTHDQSGKDSTSTRTSADSTGTGPAKLRIPQGGIFSGSAMSDSLLESGSASEADNDNGEQKVIWEKISTFYQKHCEGASELIPTDIREYVVTEVCKYPPFLKAVDAYLEDSHSDDSSKIVFLKTAFQGLALVYTTSNVTKILSELTKILEKKEYKGRDLINEILKSIFNFYYESQSDMLMSNLFYNLSGKQKYPEDRQRRVIDRLKLRYSADIKQYHMKEGIRQDKIKLEIFKSLYEICFKGQDYRSEINFDRYFSRLMKKLLPNLVPLTEMYLGLAIKCIKGEIEREARIRYGKKTRIRVAK